MADIIQWCNCNQGFLDFLLSVLSLVVSTVAIVVSVRATREPYKYKISLNITYYEEKGVPTLDFTISNLGLANAAINQIDVLDKNHLVCASVSERISLKSYESRQCSAEIFDHKDYFEDNALDLNKKVFIKVYMMDGKEIVFKKGFSVG